MTTEGISLHMLMEFRQNEAIKRAVAAGIGISLLGARGSRARRPPDDSV